MSPFHRWTLAACTAAAICATNVRADAPQPVSLNGQVLVGITSNQGNLVTYNFASGQYTLLGQITDANGSAVGGLDAAAYFPGFSTIYALKAGSDNKNKLIYVDVASRKAVTINADVEGGKFTGMATAATANNPYAVFAIQKAKIKPPSSISGAANINPNNSAANEFTLTKGNGGTITRDDLAAKDIVLTADGTYYQGDATFVHLKPKGNGNQNGLIIDGVAFQLQNSNTYDFAGQMQVRVYNDKVSGGKAMGKWWINVISGTVTVNGTQVLTPSRVTSIDQKTGTVTELMVLSRDYNGLATTNGVVFYATSDKDLYKIDVTALTETKMGTTSHDKIGDLEFVNGALVLSDPATGSVTQVNPANGANLQTPIVVTPTDLTPINFAPTSQDPGNIPAGLFD